MLTAIRDEGLAAVSRQLPAWLRATSAAGSGDDITVALAVRGRPAAFSTALSALPATSRTAQAPTARR